MNRPIRFLLVEDNPDHAALVTMTFTEGRITNDIECVPSGEKALEWLRSDASQPFRVGGGILLVDINLPGMSGLELLEAVRSDPELMAIPVVIVTTSAAERDRVAARNLHVEEYVVKPLDTRHLRTIVERLDLGWCICRNAAPAGVSA